MISKPTLRLVTKERQSSPPIADQPIDWMARLKEKIAQKATEVRKEVLNDDRIKCYQCSYLATNGLCLNATAAGAVGQYHPKPDIPRRCQGFKGGQL